MDENEIPIEMVERIIAQMVRTTLPNDEPGQRLIRKYKRLLREAKRDQRSG